MKHAQTVVIVTWQRSDHGYLSLRYETCFDSCHRDMTTVRAWFSSLRYETCSDSCHRLMTTVRAWLFISKVWNMLRQLSSWHDNGQSMVIHLYGMNHASVSCHRLMTTVRAWLFIPKVWNMLGQLSSPHDNGQSMVIHPLVMKHASSVVIVSWQRSEHDYSSLRYETCSVSCHRLMTTVRAWLFIL